MLVTDQKQQLRFQTGGNSKLPSFVNHFSLSSGHTCPGAKLCMAKVDRDSGTLVDGKDQEFRCFSATQEVAFPNLFNLRDANTKLLLSLRTEEAMTKQLIEDMIMPTIKMRVHIGGDFFSQAYFNAWMNTARHYPTVGFYAYTKSLKFWVNQLGNIPDNFTLTASRGGVYDNLIDKYKLREAVVVFHPEEAEALGLEIDHDDSLAMNKGPSFALLLHGQGKSGSSHAEALKRMKAEGVEYAYKKRK